MINLSIYNVKLVKEKGARYDIADRFIRSNEDAYRIFREVFKPEELAEEVFMLITLNSKNAVTGLFEVSRGTISASMVHPREVYKRAILNNASSIIVAHNHPSGDPTPSNEDILVTQRLKESGNLLGIKLHDHIILGDDNRNYSMLEHGHI